MAGFENELALVVCAVSTPEQDADDKESMAAQERDGLSWCANEGCEVVDIVRIPGFSRNYLTFRELMEAAEAKGEFGPTRFWEHIQNRDFTLMVVRATNRFNREQSLNAEVMARVIRAGATIYSFLDGHIHKGNYRGMSAITGYRDSTELDDLKKKRATGIVGRAKKGLPINGIPPMSHKIVFDPQTGKELRLDLRTELAPLWVDLAQLLNENVSYNSLEYELFHRWGYGRGAKPYHELKMTRLLLNPLFWGNNAIRWQDKANRYNYGVWAFAPSESAPDGVEMFWNTHEPAYTGELSELVKAELLRRRDITNGMQSKFGTSMFSGLVVCYHCHAACGYARTRRGSKEYVYLSCTKFGTKAEGIICSNGKPIRERDVQQWLNAHLLDWLKKGEVVLDTEYEVSAQKKDIEDLTALSGRLQKRMSNLMDLVGDVDEDLRTDYLAQIRKTKDELTRCKEQLHQLEHVVRTILARSQVQGIQLNKIREIGLEAFWLQPPLTINQSLKSLFGSVRLVSRDGQIVGFVDRADLGGVQKN